ncbi:MAG: anti-sigma factor domain-containing protein [Solirubrobacteraceae bacterium]
MTDTDPTGAGRRCGDDVAAYALGALTPAEAEAFQRHLERCVVCRDELAAFQQAIDELALSVPEHAAPRGLRRRLLRAVAAEPAPGTDPTRRSLTRRWGALARRRALAFGVAVVLAAAAFAGVQLSSSSVNVRVVQAQVTGRGTAELRLSDGHGQLVVRHLSPPPAGHIYEVWVVRGDHAPAPANVLFSVTANGDRDVEIPGSLQGVDRVAVTPEPDGGSPTPTHAPVIQAALT